MKKIVFIDAFSILFRAYYAMFKTSLTNSKGLPTGALLGFLRLILNIIEKEGNTKICVAFDPGGKTFRNEIYNEYKAHRKPTPEELIEQIPYSKKIIDSMQLPNLEIENYEADDVIGSYAKHYSSKGYKVKIYTGDKDYFQLIDNNIEICLLRKGVSEIDIYNTDKFIEKYGISPDRFVDVKAIMGDSSDNIPGVFGIGEKGALSLIKEFSNLEELYNNIEKIKGKKREKLEKDKETAFLSRTLSKIVIDIPVDSSIIEKDNNIYNDNFKELLKFLEFDSFLKQFFNEEIEQKKIECKIIDNIDTLNELCNKLNDQKEISIDLETTSTDSVKAKLVGLSFSFKEYEAYYIPVGHVLYLDLLTPPQNDQLSLDIVIKALKPILENKNIKKIGQNLQYEYIVLKNYGIELKGIYFDTMIAAHLLTPEKPINLDILCEKYLRHTTIKFKDMVTNTKNKLFSEVEISKAAEYAGEDAEVVVRLKEILLKELIKNNLEEVYFSIEIPLLKILSNMTLNGISLDIPYLKELELQCNSIINKQKNNIFKIAEEEFNISSTKQLSKILFEKLKLKPPKKTKTGFSTDAATLDILKKEHEIISKIIEYRKYTKLKTTYISALPELILEKDKKIHTHFNQTVTATGRLSSTNPNLQNIPVRDDFGKKIRHAFYSDNILLSADYSQIELRVLAHLSKDKNLVEAFSNDLDIHTATASKIFNVNLNNVNSNMRSYAKTINFGVVYGMNAYRLSNELDIPMKEAKEYIDNFFKKHSAILEFKENIVKYCIENGFVETILGRKRYIPDIKSSNKNKYNSAVRMAVNTVVQGSAADIMKKAMLDMSKVLENLNNSKMIVQIHDELIFELLKDDLNEFSEITRKVMENTYKMIIPLKVNISSSKYWDELK